ncbi:MAG: MBL fold metallo-hydrolase [Candidatus Bathyarchaeia archaeon]
MRETDSVKITTIVDNDVWRRGLLSSWGLSLYVEVLKGNEKHVILMDTSGSFEILYHNALKLGIDLSSVEAVFISHWHTDHCGALSQILSMLKPQTSVFVPSGDYFRIREIRGAGGVPVVCQKPIEFVEGAMSLGEIANELREHSVSINVKGKGLVVLTGCSHPGLARILKNALKVTRVETIYAVIGGFHISTMNEGLGIGEFLRNLGIRCVSPCHCTSNDAKQGIERILVNEYVRNGSGKTISID